VVKDKRGVFMKNYKMLIQYDGGEFKGWQRLGNSENTIQGKIEAVLSKMVGEPVEIVGSSRTDAGVHALGQVANFKAAVDLSEAKIKEYLNHYLPRSISVVKVTVTSERFHARYHAKAKTYLYKIWNEAHGNPFMRKYTMHVERRLDLEKMRDACQYFIGEHDFAVYANAKSTKKDTVRNIYSLDVEEDAGMIQIRICGTGFLYNMARKMVGTLIEVGLGDKEAEAIPGILLAKERSGTGGIADAGGLYLEKIEY
jgi:tRNA pseudouridine38-40 synthase